MKLPNHMMGGVTGGEEPPVKPAIFAEQAPLYWSKGLSVFFIEPGTKGPPRTADAKSWPGYCNNLPGAAVQAEWTRRFPNHGIGLLCGLEVKPGYRIAGIDVDDDQLVKAVRAALGHCPSAKFGKKGMTFFVLAEAPLKSTTLKDASGAQKVDVLINGKLTVLPPTIHPETGATYTWVGKPLLELNVDELPLLTAARLELVKLVIGAEESLVLLGGESTHEAGLTLVAKLVSKGGTDSEVEGIITGLLPDDYNGNSLAELPGWIASARAKGFSRAVTTAIDDAVADHVARELDPLIFVPPDEFLQYQNGYWRKISQNDFDRSAKKHLQPYLGSKSQVAPMLKHVGRCAVLNLEREDFGKQASKICVLNGTVDVLTGELLPWSPEHELRYQLDIQFDPEATCPTYEQQLAETLRGDEKAMATFEEFAGLTLTADMSFQKALYFVGSAGSGKSTLLRLVQAMHSPQAVSVTPLDRLDQERYLTDVVGKLVCITFDVHTRQNVFGEAFIRITGGDPVVVRKLYQEVDGMVQPTVRFMGSMNEDMPASISAADALARRLIILRGGEKVQQVDRHRFTRLMAERSGILNRWLAAVKRLLERGEFDIPEQSKIDVEEYVYTQDPVQTFVRERLVHDNNAVTPVSELYTEYVTWAEACHERVVTLTTFGKKLKATGLVQKFASVAVGGKTTTIRAYPVKVVNPLQF